MHFAFKFSAYGVCSWKNISLLPPAGDVLYFDLFSTKITSAIIMLINGMRKPTSNPTSCCTAATPE